MLELLKKKFEYRNKKDQLRKKRREIYTKQKRITLKIITEYAHNYKSLTKKLSPNTIII